MSDAFQEIVYPKKNNYLGKLMISLTVNKYGAVFLFDDSGKRNLVRDDLVKYFSELPFRQFIPFQLSTGIDCAWNTDFMPCLHFYTSWRYYDKFTDVVIRLKSKYDTMKNGEKTDE
jgi:hypothetical protein